MLAPALPGTGFRASHRALFQVSTPSGFNPSRLRDSARWAAPVARLRALGGTLLPLPVAKL